MKKNIFEIALHIEFPWYIKVIHFDSEQKRLDIDVVFRRGAVFKYEINGKVGQYKAYDTVQKTWRHLNFFEHETYIHARVPRVMPAKGKPRLIKVSWEGIMSGFTLLFESLLLQLCSCMTVYQASINSRLSV